MAPSEMAGVESIPFRDTSMEGDNRRDNQNSKRTFGVRSRVSKETAEDKILQKMIIRFRLSC